jgi:lipoprotein NlpI
MKVTLGPFDHFLTGLQFGVSKITWWCNLNRMRTTKTLLAIALLNVGVTCRAQEPSAQLADAKVMYRAGELDGALLRLEPLLKTEDLDQQLKQDIRELAVRVLQLRAEQHFRQARISKSIADFDRLVKLQPALAAELWQRGIAYYYAGEYEKGARQFELHRTVNPQDVENAVWHFLCVVRAPKGSLEVARKGLIPVTHDSRVPMAQIRQLFAGTMTPEEVLRAGDKEEGTGAFYGDLYVGLYYEALGRNKESLRLVTRAAENPAAAKSYMGDVARVHVRLRKNSEPTNKPRVPKAK